MQQNVNNWTIFLVEPNKLWQEGLGRVLSDYGYQVSGSFDGLDRTFDALDQAQAQAQAQAKAQPDIVLIDAAVIQDDSATTFQAIRDRVHDVKITVFVDPNAPRNALRCFAAGADGCLMKDMSGAAMASCLRLVTLGERVFPSSLMPSLASDVAVGSSAGWRKPSVNNLADPDNTKFSARELEILTYVAAGQSNKEIAHHTDLTEATVKVYMRNILRRLRVNNRTQAAIWALRHQNYDWPSHDSN